MPALLREVIRSPVDSTRPLLPHADDRLLRGHLLGAWSCLALRGLAVFDAVNKLVLEILKDAGLLKGRVLALDASTMDANAAMRSIVRKDTEESYAD